MQAIERALEERLAPHGVPLAVVLPGGRRLGSAHPAVTLRLNEL
jgi:cyclopropane-fatty-acyl-phospholipid synthase